MGHGAWDMGHGAWGMGHGAWGISRLLTNYPLPITHYQPQLDDLQLG
jgi:TRAP-type C4-dicarboxylate transport system permease small subunit